MSNNFNYNHSEPIEGITVFSFSGDLTEEVTESLKEDFVNIFKKNSPYFVVDLRGVDYINSSGLGFLANMLKTARKNNGDIKLSNVKPFIKNILDISKLTKVFDIFDSNEEAIQSLNSEKNKNVY
ncbi:MAG: STAS domain-containing protein [Candidatus Muiribacteriota bacterium]